MFTELHALVATGVRLTTRCADDVPSRGKSAIASGAWSKEPMTNKRVAGGACGLLRTSTLTSIKRPQRDRRGSPQTGSSRLAATSSCQDQSGLCAHNFMAPCGARQSLAAGLEGRCEIEQNTTLSEMPPRQLPAAAGPPSPRSILLAL